MKSKVFDKTGDALGIKDDAFKSLLQKLEKKVLKEVLKSFLGQIDVNRWFEDGIATIRNLPNDIPINKINEKNLRVDTLFEINNHVIMNIEANTSYGQSVKIRNISYLMKIFVNEVEKNCSFDENTIVVQINLNRGVSKRADVYNRILFRDDKNEEYLRSFVIYDYNLEKILHCWYHMDDKDERVAKRNRQIVKEYGWLLAVVLDKDELKKLRAFLAPNEMAATFIEYVERRMEEMTTKTSVFGWFPPAKEEEMLRNGLKEEGRIEGRKQGRKEGRTETEENLIKNMISSGLTPEKIHEYIKLPLERINKIAETM